MNAFFFRRPYYTTVWWKSSLEGKKKIEVTFVVRHFLGYLITMASMAGCEIMSSSEVAGSIPPVVSHKKKKKKRKKREYPMFKNL